MVTSFGVQTSFASRGDSSGAGSLLLPVRNMEAPLSRRYRGNAPGSRMVRLDRLGEGRPDACLCLGGDPRGRVDPSADELGLLAIQGVQPDQHVEALLALLGILPAQHDRADALRALVEPVEPDPPGPLRPALLAEVDPLDEGRLHEIGLGEVVVPELVDRAARIEVLGRQAPRPAVEAALRDRAREGAADELRARRLPFLEMRIDEAATLEPGL